MRILFYSALLFLALVSTVAADPLFESNEPLAITLTGPFQQLNKERDKSLRYAPASLEYNVEGDSLQIPIELQVRGNRRLSSTTCAFSPLRVIVDKKEVKDTLFHKQKKLKLVAQCRPDMKRYEGYLVTEYLIYRAFNLLTDQSYRVRLAEMTYVSEEGEPLFENYGFFLESSRRLAKRIDRKRWKVEETNATKLDRQHMNLVSLFQFMIGNTDWSATHGGREECCHNGKLYGEPDGTSNLFIPYDFDMTGLVDPEYAATPPELKLDNIRERRYRGYCRNNDFLDENIALFNAKKSEIISLFENTELLGKGVSKKKVAYIEKFYRIINNPKRVKRYIHGWCHKSEMVAASD